MVHYFSYRRRHEERLFSGGETLDFEDFRKHILLNLGKKTGVIPYNSKTSRLIKPEDALGNLEFEDRAGYGFYLEKAREMYRWAGTKLNEYLGRTQGVMSYLGKNIKRIVVRNLPVFFKLEYDSSKQRVKFLAGKVLGRYLPDKKQIEIDPQADRHVMGHELIHGGLQAQAGTLYTRPREEVEGEAMVLGEKVFNSRIDSYRREADRYKQRYGSRPVSSLSFRQHYFHQAA